MDKFLRIKLGCTSALFIFFSLLLSRSEGSQVNADIETVDCNSFGVCSQLCESTNDTFQCSCMQGFQVSENNNRSCVVPDNQWKLLFAGKTKVGYIERRINGRQLKYQVTPKDGRPIEVTYDARRNLTYWTDASSLGAAIYKGSVNGDDSNIEVIVDTGLFLPEGIAYDWITGNIYFADSNASRIAVCGNNSNLCSILMQDIGDKPRDIALNPNLGMMYWTDWGVNPAIMRAGMDGSDITPIINTDLQWPNGITVDFGNSRIYWVDAGKDRIESSLFDGQDRHTVLNKGIKHPFGIDILGDRLYWSDWSSPELKSVNKFTGEETQLHYYDAMFHVNGIAVFHEANQPIFRSNPCEGNPCPHVCTISPNSTSSFKCFCPAGMGLNEDGKTCSEPETTPKLVIAFKNTIKFMRFNSIGKDVTESITFPSIKSINAIVYDPINHTLIFSDSVTRKIYQYSIHEKTTNPLIEHHLDSVVAMDFDAVGENLYWFDEGKRMIEVMSFRTRSRLALLSAVENVYDILIVPELRSLYFSRMGKRGGKIYKMKLNGDSLEVIRRTGDKEPIALAYDKDLQNIIWVDKANREIETISTNGSANATLVSHLEGPPSDVVKFKKQLYWTDMSHPVLKTTTIGDTDIHLIRLGSFGNPAISATSFDPFMAKMTIISNDNSLMDELRNKHDCSPKNENRIPCSHICLLSGKQFNGVCKCPEGLELDEDEKTCKRTTTCGPDQFGCSDGSCISNQYVCDGIPDCTHNDDEDNCNQTLCSEENFKCESDGICIPSDWVCDGNPHCKDSSDEAAEKCAQKSCLENQFMCNSTYSCIDKTLVCDGVSDCKNAEDEGMCNGSGSDVTQVPEDLLNAAVLVSSTTTSSVSFSSQSEDTGACGIIALVMGMLMIVIIIVGISIVGFVGFVVYRRNAHPKITVRPYISQWSVLQE